MKTRLRHLLALGLYVLALHVQAGCPLQWYLRPDTNLLGAWLPDAAPIPVQNSFDSVQSVGQAICEHFDSEFRNQAAPYAPFFIAGGGAQVDVYCMKYFFYPYWGRYDWWQTGPYEAYLTSKGPNGERDAPPYMCPCSDYGQSTSSSTPQMCLTSVPKVFPTPPPEGPGNSCGCGGGSPPTGNPPLGNPIYPLSGAKRELVSTGFRVGGVELTFAYDSAGKLTGFVPDALPSLGELWSSNLHRKLGVGSGAVAVAYRGDGTVATFVLQAGTYVTEANVNDKLVAASGGYVYTDAGRRQVETYNAAGQLTRLDMADGSYLTYTYSTTVTAQSPSSGYLMQVTDNNGRILKFEYMRPAGITGADAGRLGLMTRITDAEGRSIVAAYDANRNLASLTWADTKQAQFLYESTDAPWAMTGRIDENASRSATWAYDAQGIAISTSHPGGVDAYSVSYGTPPSYTLTETEDRTAALLYWRYEGQLPQGVSIAAPNGQSMAWSATTVLGRSVLAGASQPAGSGNAASAGAVTYDTVGNVLSRDDFAGMHTCYAYDASNRETVWVEGLATTAACSGVIGAGATLPAGSRKITTAWHADWRLPVAVTQALKKTTTVYHGQPDPFNGGATASCTSAAALPNGKPLPLVCKRVEQALTSGGAVDTSVAANSTSTTYDGAGRMLTSTDANNRTTAYAYYTDTSFTGTDPNAIGHTVGDLQTVTNAAGHVTQYPQYDKAGRVRQSVDAKAIVTDIVYTPRGWVSTVTVTPPGGSGRTTTYGYDNAGQRTSVSLPDGASLAYSYDAAHRLVGVTDTRGNAISYTLDAAGNRTGEEVRDPNGALQRSISRSFDALNRLQQVSGAPQ